jgi:hypothetical protein
MPFDVAMEQPNTRVVSGKAKDQMAIGLHNHSVSPHWGSRIVVLGRVPSVEVSRIGFGSRNGLEVVAVKMEWVLTSIYQAISIKTDSLE